MSWAISSSVFVESVVVDGVVVRELSSSTSPLFYYYSSLLVAVGGSRRRYHSMASWRAPLLLAVVVVGAVVFVDIVGCCLPSASLLVPVGAVRCWYRRSCELLAVVVVCIVLNRFRWRSSLLSSSILSLCFAVHHRRAGSGIIVVIA
jgi:hypothetical protein